MRKPFKTFIKGKKSKKTDKQSASGCSFTAGGVVLEPEKIVKTEAKENGDPINPGGSRKSRYIQSGGTLPFPSRHKCALPTCACRGIQRRPHVAAVAFSTGSDSQDYAVGQGHREYLHTTGSDRLRFPAESAAIVCNRISASFVSEIKKSSHASFE